MVNSDFAGFGVYQMTQPTQENLFIWVWWGLVLVDSKPHHGTSLSEEKWHTDVMVYRLYMSHVQSKQQINYGKTTEFIFSCADQTFGEDCASITNLKLKKTPKKWQDEGPDQVDFYRCSLTATLRINSTCLLSTLKSLNICMLP